LSETEKGKDGPTPNLEKGNYLHKHNEISSSLDYKVSASNIVKGLTEVPPSSYSFKIESYNSFLKIPYLGFESRPFAAGGYNWYVGILIFIFMNRILCTKNLLMGLKRHDI